MLLHDFSDYGKVKEADGLILALDQSLCVQDPDLGTPVVVHLELVESVQEGGIEL